MSAIFNVFLNGIESLISPFIESRKVSIKRRELEYEEYMMDVNVYNTHARLCQCKVCKRVEKKMSEIEEWRKGREDMEAADFDY